MPPAVVIMGVSGCGKSSLAAVLAQKMPVRRIEGDDYHSASNRTKMSQGIALTDADREGWLASLSGLLRQTPPNVILTCSALRKTYRDTLRNAASDLRFVFLKIGPEEARRRVNQRADSHFFSPSLVDSQFATLESPESEPGVLTLDASLPVLQLAEQVVAWLAQESPP